MVVIRMDIKTRRFPIPYSINPVLRKIMGASALTCYIDRVSYPSKASLLIAANDKVALIAELKDLFETEEFDTFRFRKMELCNMAEYNDGESLGDILRKLNEEDPATVNNIRESAKGIIG